MRKFRVYIAGAINSDAVGYIKNVHRMCETAEMVRRKGFAVLIPCLDLITGLIKGDMNYDDYFDNNVEWLKVSNAVFSTPGWEDSEGTKREIKIAKELNIPVFDKIEDLIEHECKSIN